MIKITHTDGRIEINGHAGYARRGRDIVCAAVSALYWTFKASVDELAEDEIKAEKTADMIVIEYKNLSANAQLLMSSFFIGLSRLARDYPNNVKLTEHLRH